MKAKKVNNFEYTITRGDNVIQEDLEAAVSVQVGNLVKTITLHKKLYGDNEGKTVVDSLGQFRQLKEAGVEIDFSDVITAYEESAKEANKIRKVGITMNRTKVYEESWIHQFHDVKVDGVTITTPTLITFLERNAYQASKVSLEYNGVTVSVWAEKASRFSPNMAYYFSWDYKNRRYGVIENLVKKFKELVDEKDTTKARKEEMEISHKEVIKDNLAFLNKAFDNVTYEVEWRSGGIRGRGFNTDVYRIAVGDKKIRIDKEYSTDNKAPAMYSFGSFSKLSESQVKGIIEILQTKNK